MLLGKTQKTKCMTVWQRITFFGMCMSHLSHMSRSESSTVNDLWDKGLYEKLLWPRRWNCARFDDHCVKGSFNPFDGSLPLRNELKRSISTRSLPSKAPQNSSPQKCFFHTGPANPGYLACSSVDPGKGPKMCKMCWPCKFLPHSRSLYTALPTLAPLAHFERVETLRSFESPQGNFSLPGGFKCDTIAS